MSSRALAVTLALGAAGSAYGGAQSGPSRTIASIRRDSAALTAARSPVVIGGRVTLGSGLLDDTRLSIFVQDTTGGIQVFAPRIERAVHVGDSVVVSGIVTPYRGLAELANASLTIVRAPARTVTPLRVPDFLPATLARYMGRVVTLHARVASARGVGSAVRLQLRDDDAPSGDSTAVALWGTGRGDVALDRFGVGDHVQATGILARRDERDINAAEYVLLAVSRTDVDHIGMTSRERTMALLALIPAGLVLGLLVMRSQAKRRNRELAALERRLNALYEHSPDAVLVLDANWRIQEANAAASRLTGLAAASLDRLGLFELFAPGDGALLAQAGDDIRLLGSVDLDGHLVRSGDEPVAVSVRMSVVPEGDGRRILVVMRDLSKQRALEDQLRQAQKMEAVGQLAGGVAHDFNNLLTVILGHSDLLAEDLALQPAQLGDVRVIQDAGHRAAALTQQLLAFSRKQVLQARSLDLNAVIGGVALMLRGLLGEDVQVTLDLAADACCVVADPGQVSQVLMNLAVNARDAMPGGGRLAIATSVVDASAMPLRAHPRPEQGEFVMLRVTDTGVGMPANVQRRAFEPFFTTKPVGKGTGLGLATAYGIIRQSGGYVELESVEGAGTTVRIYLPRQGPADVADAAPSPATSPNGSGTVLLVEDESDLRSLAERVLARAGYTVLAASDGTEALQRAENHPGRIDLVVTDVVMPGMSGRELFARLRERGRCDRVLYISGYPDDEILRRGLEQGDTEFLEKPFRGEELTARVQSVLGGQE